MPFAETDAAGTNATVTVKVERADRDATLALRAGGRIVQTWSGVAAGQTVEGRFPVGLGATKDYAFTLTHEDSATGERYEVVAEGTVLGRPAVGWLDVRFDCDKGAEVISYNITRGGKDDLRALNIMAVVKVDGNLFQRIIGWLYDRYLKARAWSLY